MHRRTLPCCRFGLPSLRRLRLTVMMVMSVVCSGGLLNLVGIITYQNIKYYFIQLTKNSWPTKMSTPTSYKSHRHLDLKRRPPHPRSYTIIYQLTSPSEVKFIRRQPAATAATNPTIFISSSTHAVFSPVAILHHCNHLLFVNEHIEVILHQVFIHHC